MDLFFTDATAVVDVSVTPPLGTSEHSGLSFKINISFLLQNDHTAVKVHLKSGASWYGVATDLYDINWSSICGSRRSDYRVKGEFSVKLFEIDLRTKRGLMKNADMHNETSRQHITSGPDPVPLCPTCSTIHLLRECILGHK